MLYQILAFHYNEMKMQSLKSIHSAIMGKRGLVVKGAALSAKLDMKEWLSLGGHFLAHLHGIF